MGQDGLRDRVRRFQPLRANESSERCNGSCRTFLDADAMTKWLPPNGFTGKVHQLDAKVGGTHLLRRVILDKGDASLSFDPFQTERPIGRCTRQDHAYCLFSLMLRQRTEELVDGPMLPSDLGQREEFQYSIRLIEQLVSTRFERATTRRPSCAFQQRLTP